MLVRNYNVWVFGKFVGTLNGIHFETFADDILYSKLSKLEIGEKHTIHLNGGDYVYEFCGFAVAKRQH